MASILDLPAELVIGIASYLTTEELGPLRRSCKQLERHMFETFAKEFFTKRQFMIQRTSLQALVDISNHPTLSERLQEVIISTDVFECDEIPREWLLRTGQARDMLAEAFSKLKNLRIVGLRDFNSKGRVREGGPEALWRSYGWSKEPATTLLGMDSDTSPGSLFSLILCALGIASSYPPDVQVILRKHNTLVPHAFIVNATNAPVISKLKTLFLALHADNTTISRNPSCEDLLRRFLHTATDVEVLRLNFDSRWSAASRLLTWLGTMPSATDLKLDDPKLLDIPPAPLSHLTSLEIGMASVSAPSLTRALSRSNLKSFSLWRVTISDMDMTRPTAGHWEPDLWQQFLGDLSGAMNGSDSVKSILIGLIAQVTRVVSHVPTWEKVQFCPEGTSDKGDLKVESLHKEVKFRARYGMSASRWLKDLSERTYVRSIHGAPESPEVDSEDEDEQSDDDSEEDEHEEADDEGDGEE
ncbi:uncharacterized protein RCC_00675 [Ramularia collo-cygni]|uniref:F-box domain-containing protein n=1 Tax=Ramularia collo-cygni TaxID=112498 RepID=A0A2D3UUT8_9PEZI|nr:uncharacterized protein RCC_00675 [Ramularia collo-cygni]CZT14706.1 uncharacterized protein RCC_00675 [Ramularia collo-cygni]